MEPRKRGRDEETSRVASIEELDGEEMMTFTVSSSSDLTLQAKEHRAHFGFSIDREINSCIELSSGGFIVNQPIATRKTTNRIVISAPDASDVPWKVPVCDTE